VCLAGVTTFVVRRILFAVPVFLAVSIITFVGMNAIVNPVDIVRLGLRNPSAAQLQAVCDYFRCNQPVYERYFYWLVAFVQGDMGKSLYGGTVSGLIGPWIWTTLEIQIPALLLSLAIGIPVGIYSAKHQYSKGDVTVTTTAIFGVSTPTFWLGIMAIIIFSADLRWLPPGGALSPYPPYIGGSVYTDLIVHAIMPILVLTFVSLATIVRLIRASMLDTLRQDFILAARASGVDERSVVYKHALKNAITPIVTVVGLSFGTLLAGAPALETTFSWPGLGYEFVRAVGGFDLPLVQGLTMIIAIMVLVANIGTDLVYAVLDPRVRLA
jgi:ABC-type dipeptide/oligopeptide/nickel transport system permease component